MSSLELTYWLELESMEPSGPLMDDFRAGTIAATVYNMNRSAKAKALGASDFMPALKASQQAHRQATEAAKPVAKSPAKPPTAEQTAAWLDAVFGF